MNEHLPSEELNINRIYNQSYASAYGLEIDSTYTQYLKYLLLERYADSESACLDIGIGNGNLALPLARLVQHIHGVDVSPDMLAECRRNLEASHIDNVSLHQQDLTEIGFDDAQFDLVYCFSTLLLIPDIDATFETIGRVLKPGGVAILDITGKRNLSRIHWEKQYWRKAGVCLHSYTLTEIRAIFARLRLTVLESHSLGFLEQWKYIWGIRYLTFLNRIVHETRHTPDRDYRASQHFPMLANRWYFVLRKTP